MADIKEGVAVVTVGRTAPIPPGPQLASNSLPVVIASDQGTLPVRVENQQISEVSLSLLGIPRSEVALGIFADVTTYDINPNEWQSQGSGTTTHIPSESAAKVAVSGSTTNAFQTLGSKRFFRYQPGRVSAATFGVRTSISADTTDIKKFGAFDGRDGYYLEVQGGNQTSTTDKDFNLFAVRRTSALESNEPGILTANTADGDVGEAGADLVIVRAGLTYIHAALFDRSLRGSGNNIGGNASSNEAVTVSDSFLTVPNENRYTYEYRVPRKFFSHDRLDAAVRPQFYSDRTPNRTSFTVSIDGTLGPSRPVVTYGEPSFVLDADGEPVSRASVWNIDFSKVTMFKVEYSWYGAVGAHFLAYVPDATTAGEARWVRMHHIRTSNQLTSPSLANPTLPITYIAQKADSANECAVYKYGASYYIDGGDKGTITARSTSNTTDRSVAVSGVTLLALRTRNTINSIRNRMQVYPTRLGIGTSDRGVVRLIKNPTTVSGTPVFTSAGTLSPIEVSLSSGVTTVSGGITVATFFVGAGGVDIDLSPYFGYNKDYLSYPLTAASGDTLYVFAQSASGTINASASLSWEEQV